MPINTDLNVTPYYDDYDEDKKYHRVLFRPSVPVQARELTQLQTILQNQVERFGEHMFKDGTIVKGATFTDQNILFAKLNDANTSLGQLVMSEFDNTHVVTSSNLIAQVFETKAGFESTNPDLNTIFFQYVNSGNNAGTEEVQFSAGQTLDVYSTNTTIDTVTLTSNTGTGYSNNDTITFSSTFGSNGSANLTTNSTGGIVGTSINNTAAKGFSFKITDIPTVANIVTSTGSSANLELFTVSLTKKNIVTIANTSFNDATGNTDFNTIGLGKRFEITDGIIFQKGHFTQVSEQSIMVSDYTSLPNNIAVGFQTTETIANNTSDTSLTDNASGFQNENAPGAYRLKLTPTLVVNTVANAEATNNFFIVARYESGNIVTTSGETIYNKLGDRLAKRTSEESGNYVKKPFVVKTEGIDANTTHLNISVDPGIAYIGGYRVQTVGTSRLPTPKADTTQNVSSAVVSTNYGAYQLADELVGHFAFNHAAEVKLLDTAGNRLSTSLGTAVPTVPTTSNTTVITGTNPSYTGNILGTAKIRSVVYEKNTPGTPLGQYRLYLFDINMNQGKNYKDVRAIWYNAEGIADVTLDDNANASLSETDFRTLVTETGREGIKGTNINGTSNNQYIYRTVKTDGELATNGSITFTTTGTETFPYTAGAFLNATQEKDWIIVSNNETAQTVSLTGTVAVTSGAGNVTGTSTTFTAEYKEGDFITVADANTHRVTSVVNNTLMVTANNFGASVSGKTHARYFPVDVPINMDGTSSNVYVGTNSNTVTINATRGKALHGSQSLAVHVTHNVKKTSAPQLDKTLATSFVKIVCSNNAGGTTGPWCLGIPDVYDIQDVMVANQAYWDGSTAANSTVVQRKENFRLDTGQKDGFYSLGKLYKDQSNAITHVANDFFTVKVRHFKKDTSGGGKGFFTVDSYPVDDTTANSTNEYIKTEDIPIFISEVTGQQVDLRNSIDFRPVAANTATQAAAVGDATINPNVAVSFAASEHSIAAPNENFQYDYQYYIPRIDKVYLSSKGAMEVVQGAPGLRPLAPKDVDDAITLGTLDIPVYPSLSTKEARVAKRLDYAVTNKSNQNRGYTMEDIGQIDKRVNRLEYYSSLNLLEKQTKDLTIPAESNNAIDRFKQGFLVDNFIDLSIADTRDEDFNIGRNKVEQTIIPKFKQNGLNLSVAGHSNTQLTGDTLTHPYSAVAFMGQRFATTNRSATQGNWQWNGTIQLFPNYDGWTDTRFNPDNVMTIDVDLSDQFNSLMDGLNSIEALTETDREILAQSTKRTVTGSNGGGEWGVQHTTTTQRETRSLFQGESSVNKRRVGEMVTDIRMSPFIREQMIHFHAWGLRPNKRHYVFFDGKDVNANTRPALSTNTTTHSKGTIYAAGAYGANLVTDSAGEMFGIFHLPSNEFAVGERHLIIADNATYSDIVNNSISTADEPFNAYNFGIEKGALDQTVRAPVIRRNTIQEVTTVTESSRWARQYPPPTPPRQPAGTFCFIAGTKVMMDGHSEKNIEDVVVGDKVHRHDGGYNTVQELFKTPLGNRKLCAINGGKYFFTDDHPLMTDKGWAAVDPKAASLLHKEVGEPVTTLQEGMTITGHAGADVVIETLTAKEDDPNIQTYNFRLDGNHEYFADGFLAHNRGACFMPGTLMTLADGSQKKIEEIEIGTKLLGADDTINEVKVILNPKTNGRRLANINNKGFFVTEDHPFMTTDGWKSCNKEMSNENYPHLEINQLEIGDEIKCKGNEVEKVTSIEFKEVDADTDLHNFTLDGDHTYIANGLVAHNKGDPLAQTFKMTGPDLETLPGVQITSVDLYFSEKDSALGVTIEIRKVVNGFPGAEVMPFGRKHLKSSQVSTSLDGQTATAVVFDGPVYLSTNEEYCIVILPDGNAPDYRCWLSKTGGVDISSGQPVVSDQFVGSMFLSTNNTAWKPLIDEDLKFTLYRAGFSNDSSNSGVVTLHNKANEYLSLNSINGVFKQGEIVFQVNASAQTTGTATMSTSNTIVTGTGTAFNTEYAAGDFITFSNTTAQDTVEIDSVTNSTQIILKGYPLIANTTGIAVTKTPTGIIYYYDSTNKDMHIEDSTAASATFKFGAGASIIGAESGANATIESVDDKAVSYLEPVLYKTNPSLTDVQMFIHANTATGDTGNTQIRTNDRSYFKEKAVVKSKSNDLTGKFKTYFKMSTNTTRMSPMIDSQTLGINMYENQINNDTTNEHITGQGNALASYVSKAVTLDDGLDAEDLRVYLTAYKPGRDNCQIKVFGKILSEEDTDTFYDRHWTELELIGEDHFSNDDNRLDYREYQYQIPQTPATTFVENAQTFGNTTITTASDVSSTLTAGTLVKVTNSDPNTDYQISTVASASGTAIVLDEAIGFANNTGAAVSTVTLPQTGFKDPQNDKIVTYYNSSGSKFTTYKVFAIKILLLSDSTATAPAVKDYRAIALSV